MASIPPGITSKLEASTVTAMNKVNNPDGVKQLMYAPLLGGVPLAGIFPPPGGREGLSSTVKSAVASLLTDKALLGTAIDERIQAALKNAPAQSSGALDSSTIDARIAEAVKKAPSSGGINASSVDSKIAKALEGIDSKISKAVEGFDSKISKAVEGHLTASNLGKMRLAPVSGGGRRGTKRGKRSGSKRAKRGTKRR